MEEAKIFHYGWWMPAERPQLLNIKDLQKKNLHSSMTFFHVFVRFNPDNREFELLL